MRLALTHRPRRSAGLTALIAGLIVVPLTSAAPASAAPAAPAASMQIPAPSHRGTLRITGQPRDGAVVAASGLAWTAPRLPRGMRLLSFEVAYTWQSCGPAGSPSAAGPGT
jgi:hypothetical protein